jgi:CheY-like chemotaxis protein
MANILIADDVKEMRILLKALLTGAEHNVLEAESGVQAMELLEKNKDVDLLLLDIRMPNMDGFQVLTRIGEMFPKGVRPRVCFISSSADREAVMKAVELGGDGYIVKPIDPKLLMEKVNSLLSKPREIPGDAQRKEVSFEASLVGLPVPWFFTIEELGESGCLFSSPIELKRGGSIQLQSADLERIQGTPKPLSARIVECSKKDNTYQIKVLFFGLSDTVTNRLRQFIAQPQKMEAPPAKSK